MYTDRGEAEPALLKKLWRSEAAKTPISVEKDPRVDQLCYLFLIFLTGCLVGWIYEEIFYWVTEGLLRNRGILYGPWLPIYGVGALAIYAMKPVKKQPVLLFLLCTAVSGIVEYIIGYAGLHLFGLRLWDYRGLLLNIDGIICLRSVLSFGLMGLVFHYWLEPAAERMVKKMNPHTVHSVCLWLLTMISMFSIGLMVASLCRTTKSMNVVTSLLYFPMLLFSGATIPAEVFPAWFQAVAKLMPLGVGIDLLKSVSMGCYDRITVPVITLIAITVICGTVAVKTFRWE